jgi:hypothetical protein
MNTILFFVVLIMITIDIISVVVRVFKIDIFSTQIRQILMIFYAFSVFTLIFVVEHPIFLIVIALEIIVLTSLDEKKLSDKAIKRIDLISNIIALLSLILFAYQNIDITKIF